MARVQPNQRFFSQIVADLGQQITPEQARAIKAAVGALDADAIVSAQTIDALGLPPNVRANLIFTLLNRAYPDQVGTHLRTANRIAGVMTTMLAAGKTTIDWGQLPAYLEEFAARLLSDPSVARTGKVSLGDVGSWQVELAGCGKERIELRVRQAGAVSVLVFERPDLKLPQTWQVAWANERPALTSLDVPSLSGLHDKLVPLSARGAQDAMLELLRGERDRASDGALDQLLEAIAAVRDRKLAARAQQLQAVDAALRSALAAHVGEAPKPAVDALAQAALAATS